MSKQTTQQPQRVVMLPPLPKRAEDGNKGSFGRVAIIGGQALMVGAPLLCGRAALVSGSGLVQVIVPAANLPVTLAALPELLGGVQEDRPAIEKNLEAADAVAIGPGLGIRPEAETLLDIVLTSTKPTVIDADALNMLSARAQWDARTAGRVITPHPGEMRRLLRHLPGLTDVPSDVVGRAFLANAAAAAWQCVVVLKGSGTVVAWPDGFTVNTTGDVSLAKGGTGDVLTGVIASLLGQGMAAHDAAMAGVWVHGRAGELAGAEKTPRAVLASDVIAHLPAAFVEYSARFGSAG